MMIKENKKAFKGKPFSLIQVGLVISLLIFNAILWLLFVIKILIIEWRLAKFGWLVLSILLSPIVPIMFYITYYGKFLNGKATIKQIVLD